MAASSSINQRIVLTGAEEVRRHLEEIGKAGERSGNQTRAALVAATQGTNSFTAGTKAAAGSSGQMRFALQNLSFQVNDVATSLASGGDVMRVFAQQGGQVFQVFQQGGGARAVVGGAATAINSMITPMRLAAGGALALTAAIGALIARSVDSQTSAKQFGAQLEGLGKSSRISGKELEAAARRLRDIGLGIDDARKKLQAGIAGGLDPKQAERIVRIGNDLNRVFGEGTLDEFIAAAAKGGEPLRQFAERLGLIPKAATDATAGLQTASLAVSQSTQSIFSAIVDRNRAIVDEQRNTNQQIADLTRRKGTAEEEIQLQSSRRVQEINRQSNVAINDLIAQRNADSQKRIAEHNKAIEDAAQKAASGGESIITQIEQRVKGLDEKSLGPAEQTTRRLSVAWQDFLTSASNTGPIQTTINEFTNLIRIFTDTNNLLKDMARNRAAFFAAGGGAPIAMAPVPGFAAGTGGTPPGTILVGERGPELITQPGGLSVWSNQQTERLLSAFRSLNMPLMPRSRRFQTGTIGNMAAGGGSPIYLTFPGGATVGPMMADRQVRQAMEREGRKASMLSAGRKPSTA